MIFADKLILLRKKNGLSQEALAEKLDVTRQAVSRWEGAQTYPDLSKIILISKMFGVSTDYLLKDEIEDEKALSDTAEDKTYEKRKINKEETVSYLKSYKYIAAYYAVSIMLFILGPVIGLSIYFTISANNYRPDAVIGSAGYLISGNSDYPDIVISTTSAVIVCAVLLVAALAIFIVALQKSKKCRQIIKVPFGLEVETQEYLLAQMSKYVKFFFGLKVSAICPAAVAIVLTATGIICMDVYSDESLLLDFLLPSVLLLILSLMAVEVHVTLKRALDRIVMKGSFDENALKKKRTIILSILYWAVVAVAFAAGRSVTKEWYFSCALLAFAVLIYFSVLIVTVVYRNNSRKNKNDFEV